jgi:hypothetical protein
MYAKTKIDDCTADKPSCTLPDCLEANKCVLDPVCGRYGCDREDRLELVRIGDEEPVTRCQPHRKHYLGVTT